MLSGDDILTVYFSLVIERESVSTTIVRAMCDVNRRVESVTFVRDEQNVVSLWTTDDPPNLIVVRVRCLSVLHTHPHMYPERSASLHLKLVRYVKDPVLLRTM